MDDDEKARETARKNRLTALLLLLVGLVVWLVYMQMSEDNPSGAPAFSVAAAIR